VQFDAARMAAGRGSDVLRDDVLVVFGQCVLCPQREVAIPQPWADHLVAVLKRAVEDSASHALSRVGIPERILARGCDGSDRAGEVVAATDVDAMLEERQRIEGARAEVSSKRLVPVLRIVR